MTKPVTVLIIEDDELLREVYSMKLELEGFAVATATDGLDGLSKASQNEPDVILLDMLMPRMTGLEFLKAYGLRAHHPRVKTIILSNKSTTAEINEAKTMGVREYLIKSQHTPQEIVSHIKSHLDDGLIQ